MVLRKLADRQSLLEGRFQRRRFTRRADLTNSIRLTIAANALHAMIHGVWGAITSLADEYGISRPFVYSLADTLKDVGQFLFGETAEFVSVSSPRERSIQMMFGVGGVYQLNYPALFKHHEESRHPRATQADYALSQPSALL
jgi:hypothetical protein